MNSPIPSDPVIDIHGHSHVGEPELTETIYRSARRWNIKHVVLLGDVLGFGFFPSQKQIRRINDSTIEACRAYPDFYIGFCHLNVKHPAVFLKAEIDRCIRKHGLAGIKLEVSANARSRKLDPIMRKAREYGVPILHHAWHKSTGMLPHESTAADIAHLAARFPDVTILMAHLSGVGERGVQDIAPFPNVLIDTSGGQPVAGLVEYAAEKLGADRVVYGSDIPYRDFSCQLGRILGAKISAAQTTKILYGNAARLLGLKE
ncbi:amidohydrolase family protein [Planctomycetota bacterium]